jgi:TonB family protein
MPDKPLEQVQTGGFGDPNGLPADSSNKRGNAPRFGSPALLPGPGYGNGAGGVTGRSGSVATAGFGNDAEISVGSKGSRPEVKQGSFETAAVGSAVPGAKQTGTPTDVQPVVILSKPDPVYSDEARRLGLEGEVLVEVVFLASGQVKVLRVTNGLGHGLDEAAVRAAQQIRFKPALQEGKPIDFPATVRIQFELAF